MPGSASSPGRTSAEGDEGTAATPLELGATDSLAYDMERVQEHDAQHIGDGGNGCRKYPGRRPSTETLGVESYTL